jgi:hypothetical protein
MWRKFRNRWKDAQGDILMEYVILTVFIIFPLVVYENMLFDPAGSVSGKFGYFGQQFVDWYQRILCGMSLPIP